MRRRTFLKGGAVLTAGLASSPFVFPEAETEAFLRIQGKKTSSVKKDLPVLVLEGPPRKRGQIHGESLRPKIKEIIVLWKDFIHQSKQIKSEDYISAFLEDTNFKAAIQKWTPNLLEETIGLSEGSGIDFDTIYAFQLMDEEWWYGGNWMRRRESKSKNCSGLGVFALSNRPAMQAQNMDLPGITDGFQTLLHIKYPESSLESFIFTFAGLVGTNGMNNRPIGVCVNTLSQLNYSTDGLHVAYVIRGILERKTHEEAVDFVQTIKHASGQNYIIGGGSLVYDFECSAHSTRRFIPYEGADRVYHTNHPLVNEDQQMYKEMLKNLAPPAQQQRISNSEARFQTLERRLKGPGKPITLDTVKETLSSHDHPQYPVCRHKTPEGRGMTFGCTIMVLSSSPEFHVAPGPPCETEFTSFKF
jgi:isopenicillin-N N-acyltransferase-like protein